MPETKTPNRSPKRKPSDPKDRPVRDSQEKPAPNPASDGDQPDTRTRDEVEAIRWNLKR